MVEDICKATGKNVTRVLLESIRPDERVRIISKRLNPSFYDDLVDDFSHVANRLEVVVKDYKPSVGRTKFGQFLLENSALYSFDAAVHASVDAKRFMLVGERAFRLCVRDTPYKAHSFIENEMIGKFLSRQFDAVRNVSKLVSPAEPNGHTEPHQRLGM